MNKNHFISHYLGLIIGVFISVCVRHNSVFAHVGLTYPPARKFDLDFLDNIRTKPPCGMPKGNVATTLVSGSRINITWHLSYPHRGGYRLELLDKNEQFVLDLLTGKNTSDFMIGDPTAQWHTIALPNGLTCDDCSIRLRRQASEWSNAYGFWSCADVRIVRSNEYVEDCFDHGKMTGGGCKCDRGYWGPRCQFEDECTSDSDCGKGTCVDLGGTALPRKQCFCPPGMFGDKCQKRNKATLATHANLDVSGHTKEELSNKMTLYYKVIPAPEETEKEIEFVLVVNGTSYGAVGWRPASFNKSCKLWPYVEEKVSARSIRQAIKIKPYKPNPTLLRPLNALERSMAEPEPSMNQKLKKTENRQQKLPEPEPKPEAEPEVASEPKPEAEPEVASEPKPEKSVAESEPSSEPVPESEATKPVPESEPHSEPTPESEPEKSIPKSEPHAEPTPESEPHSEPVPESEPHNPVPESEPHKPTPESEPVPESEPEKPIPESESGPKSEPETSAVEPEPEKSVAEPEPEKSVAEPEPEKSVAEPEPEKSAAEPEPEKSVAEPEPEKSVAEPEPEKSVAEPEPEKSAAEPEPEKSVAEPEPEKSVAEPEPEKSAAEPEPEKSVAEPEPEKSAVEPEPEKSAAEPEPEKSAAEPEPGKPAPESEPQSEPETPTTESEPNKSSNKSLLKGPYPESEPESDAESEPEIGFEPEPENPHRDEASAEPESLNSLHYGLKNDGKLFSKETRRSAYSPKGDFHAMDCTDIIMGAARGVYSRIRDYYTRDRSTPRPDLFWGGSDALTSATGWEKDGITTLVFRRKVISTESTDHSIEGQMHVIWARGQQHGMYVHSPKSGIETESPSVPNFYAEDEIKYHGHKGQRGVTYIDFSG